jgi:hypothetical protein
MMNLVEIFKPDVAITAAEGLEKGRMDQASCRKKGSVCIRKLLHGDGKCLGYYKQELRKRWVAYLSDNALRTRKNRLRGQGRSFSKQILTQCLETAILNF